MAIHIDYDNNNMPIVPQFILTKRTGDTIGLITNIGSIDIDANINAPTVSFKVSKGDNERECVVWDNLIDFKLIYCEEWDTWFEITVTLSDGEEVIKTINGTQLEQSELSQINLYNIEINTEDDISRDDYTEPSVIYNPSNTSASIIQRILADKVPHYTGLHVDSSLCNIQRTFTFNGKDIKSALDEISEEINCVVVYGERKNNDRVPQRTISLYDLSHVCLDCGYRDEDFDVCPECGSTNIYNGYGNDTTIFVSKDNLTDEIEYSLDSNSVKNCFKLTAGDDVMTATVANYNPNGSLYIWRFSEEMLDDMPSELSSKIAEYNNVYTQNLNERQFDLSVAKINLYNALIQKYDSENYSERAISTPVIGYKNLTNALYNIIDFRLYLTKSMLPTRSLPETTALEQADLLVADILSPISPANYTSASKTTVDSYVLNVAKIIVDYRYNVKIEESAYDSETHEWVGSFRVINYSDEDDTAISSSATISITDDYTNYVAQKIEMLINKKEVEEYSLSRILNMEVTYNEGGTYSGDLIDELEKYNLAALDYIRNSCQSIIDILTEASAGSGDSYDSLYEELYDPYFTKLLAIEYIIGIVDTEIIYIDNLYSEIDTFRNTIKSDLNFKDYLGDDLWDVFCSYRREDEYTNDNYISDGLTNAELIEKAKEFYEVAQREILKSSTYQHRITSNLKNLLTINDFSPLVNYFELWNWIRIEVDGEIYKLRLIGYNVNFTNFDDISVEFSDVIKGGTIESDSQSIYSKLSSMASSYNSVAKQASNGSEAQVSIDTWKTNGFYSSVMPIISGVNNAITQDEHGMLFRSYNEVEDTYDDTQLKIVNSTLAITDDNWHTVKTAIGKFRYLDPETNTERLVYGVNGETIIGKLLLGEELGLYNSDASLKFNNNGLLVTNGINTISINPNDTSIFTVSNNNGDVISFDSSGNGIFNGTLFASLGEIGGYSITHYNLFSQFSTQNQSWVEQPVYDSDGNQIYNTESAYDENGNPIYETDDNGNILYETSVAYDDEGNIIYKRDGASSSGDVVVTPSEFEKDYINTFEMDILPIQQLNNFDRPFIKGNGDNLFDSNIRFNSTLTETETTIDGLTLVTDGISYTISGTASQSGSISTNIAYLDGSTEIYLAPGTYVFTGTGITYSIKLFDTSDIITVQANVPFTTQSIFRLVYGIFNYVEGETYNISSFLSLTKGSVALTSYVQTENICPISSGIDNIDCIITGKNLTYPNALSANMSKCYLSGARINTSTFTIDRAGVESDGTYYPFVGAGVLYTDMVLPNHTYVVSRSSADVFAIGTTEELPQASDGTNPGTSLTQCISDNTATSLSITTGVNDKYIVVYVFDHQSSSGSVDSYETTEEETEALTLREEIIAGIQIEVGTSATTFVSPREPSTINIDLDNTVYQGEYDAITGTLTITHVLLTKNTATMDNDDETKPGWKDSGIKALIGSGKNTTISATMNIGNAYSVNTIGDNDILYLDIENYSTLQSVFIEKAIDVQIVVELATPTVVQLNVVDYESSLEDGINTIFSSNFININFSYASDELVYEEVIVYDENGNIMYDSDGNVITRSEPVIETILVPIQKTILVPATEQVLVIEDEYYENYAILSSNTDIVFSVGATETYTGYDGNSIPDPSSGKIQLYNNGKLVSTSSVISNPDGEPALFIERTRSNSIITTASMYSVDSDEPALGFRFKTSADDNYTYSTVIDKNGIHSYTANQANCGDDTYRWNYVYSKYIDVNSTSTLGNIVNLYDDASRKRTVIQMYNDGNSNYGSNLVIDAGGNTFIGSGEASKNLYTAAYKNSASEMLFLCSDEHIMFNVNCQNIAQRKTICLDSSLNLRPTTNAVGNLGTASYRWDNIYSVHSVSVSSDEKVKTDLRKIDKAKELLMNIKPYQFKFTYEGSDRIHYGFSSQQFKKTLDEIGIENCGAWTLDVTDEGKKNGHNRETATEDEKIYGLRYEELIAPIVQVLQEYESRITELEEKLKGL